MILVLIDIKDRPEIKHLAVITELRDELLYMNKGHQTINGHTHTKQRYEKNTQNNSSEKICPGRFLRQQS